MTTRRQLLIIAATGVYAPGALLAQSKPRMGNVWRVGYLAQASRPDALSSGTYGVFQQELRELGYVEGKNLVIEWRFADNKAEHLQELAAELVRLKVDVIVTGSAAVTKVAQGATTTTPIVMGSGGDLVALGLAKSYARPGGNITGVLNIADQFSPKLLEMLQSIVPRLSRVTVLTNPDNPGIPRLASTRAAAERLGLRIVVVEARSLHEIEKVLPAMNGEKSGALLLSPQPLFRQHINRIVELATRNRVPSIASWREYAEAGGLMSYGPDSAEQWRRAANLVVKILKGANPAELPIEQPTRLGLVVNQKTAKSLGLTVPQSLLITADKVIE